MIFRDYELLSLTHFKYEKDRELFFCLHPVLLSIYFGVVVPTFKEFGIKKITITRTCDEKIKGISMTDVHRSGRAIDIRTRDMFLEFSKENGEIKKKQLEKRLNDELAKEFGAVSMRTGKKVFALYHNGTEEHLHLQITDLPINYIQQRGFYGIKKD